MAGVPQSSFEAWASKFIGLDLKVDEMETTLAKAVREREPAARKEKIVRRELTGILTRGTLHGDFRTTDSSNYVLCLREAAEAGGERALGACLCDVGTGEFLLKRRRELRAAGDAADPDAAVGARVCAQGAVAGDAQAPARPLRRPRDAQRAR
jgi:DNA mismatch repair ATPase MutS